MIEDKISLLFINQSYQVETIRWPLKELDYVEQLVHEVLEARGVGPVYRNLFGIKLTSQGIWLPPNLKLKRLKDGSKKHKNDLKLELRLRFRPSCYKKLNVLDKSAFNIIFAQLRHDFIRTKFNKDKRDFVLLNDAVLGLIATDLLRHSVEKNISINDILKRVNPKDFIPKRASKWQSLLLFRLAEKINLQKTLEIGYDRCANNVDRLKLKFIQLFLSEVAQDYGAEVYKVEGVTNLSIISATCPHIVDSCPMDIRVRYQQTDDESFCFIEHRATNKKEDWEVLCDIETISHGTSQQNIIQIARLNRGPMRFKFDTTGHAESFLSCLDGYYRLMRKWNFHMCREIFSPELMFLKQIRCHGPIGYETSRQKLNKNPRIGTYLVRKCMEQSHRYLIDLNLRSNARLTIDVDYDPPTKVYMVTSHDVNKKIQVTLNSGPNKFHSLRDLIQGISVWIHEDKDYPQGLLHWLQPGEYDDYPALLLSISKRKLREFDDGGRSKWQQQSLPNLIPTQLIKLTGKQFTQANNGLIVKSACLGGDREVVIKSRLNVENHDSCILSSSSSNNNNTLAFYYNPMEKYRDEQHEDNNAKQMATVELDRLWRMTWPFLRHQFIAETIGFDAGSISMIQEYFPHGPLDGFLRENVRVSSVFKLAIACQLSEALLYLRERQLIHGKIRCHNIFVKQINPIQIKLADPLGPFDVVKDKAFIPVEYDGIRGQHIKRQYDFGIDVWAFGTTLWQIYSNGSRPPEGHFASEKLRMPKDCSNKVWSLIESCWLDCNRRASPQTLFRDLNDLFAWEKGVHGYFYIEQEQEQQQQQPCLPNKNQPTTSSGQLDTTTGLPGSALKSHSSPPDVTVSCGSSVSSTITTTPTTSASSSGGSHSNLLRILESGYRRTASSKAATRHQPRPSVGSLGPETSTSINYVKRHSRTGANWRSIVNFRGRLSFSNEPNNYPTRSNNTTNEPRSMRVFGDESVDSCSRLSLSDCSTPSGSEITKFTDVPDFQGISDAFDRCVWHVDSNRLKLGPEIGRGTSGIVIKGVLSPVDSATTVAAAAAASDEEQVVAVKCIDTECVDFNLNKIEDLRREFDILKNLNHKNIVRTLGYVEESYMMLIFEYMPLGSLLSCIRNSHHDDLRSLPLAKYASDIAEGMDYLERMKIVHRDLALRNILAKSLNEVKICDFGLAQFLGAQDHYKLKTERALPLKWYAPETLITWKFTHKSDVWSYGIVLWEIYSGGNSPQYSGTYANLAQTLRHERLPWPNGCPKQMYELMLKCWAYEPEDRETFAQIGEKLAQFSS